MPVTTDISAKADFYIFDYDDLSYAIQFLSGDSSANPIVYTNLDITNYAFDCYFIHSGQQVSSYSIAAGATTGTYLSKTSNQLNITGMLQDIRSKMVAYAGNKLLIVGTNPGGQTFDYATITIYGDKH